MRQQSNRSGNICLILQFSGFFLIIWLTGRGLRIMCHSDQQISQTLQKSANYLSHRTRSACRSAFLLALPLLLAGACKSPEPVVTVPASQCAEDGRLTADLYGGLRASLDWQGDVLECDGMPRPNGEGARLHFAGPAQDGSAKRSLAFILAIPDLQQGETATELPTNVTVIEEGTGRFFGTQNTENCWSDIQRNEQVGNMDDWDYRVSGIVYCLAPLAELNGTASVTFAEMKFTGRLTWETPK
jgi:hypothetical protein